MLSGLKKTGNIEKFSEAYIGQILLKLDVMDIVDYLERVSAGKDVALVCFESPNKFCHRQLVSFWMNQYGFRVKEI